MSSPLAFAFLCLLGAVVASAAADEWHEGMLLSDWLHSSSGSSTKVKPASGSYERPDIKRLCLKETKFSYCQAVGCQVSSNCRNASVCSTCSPEIMGQSDLACCSGKSHDGYGEPSDAWAQLKVGSCDWQIRKFYCPPEYEGRCGSANSTLGGIELDNRAVKFADAWATCYLNSDSEYCGEPLCDKMVMSFQGSVFAVYAHAEVTPSPQRDQECPSFDFSNSTTAGPWRGLGSGLRDTSIGRRISAEQQPGGSVPSRPWKSGRKDMYGEGDYSSTSETAPQYASGMGIIFSGPVVISSMAKKVSHSRGMMEYVYDFVQSRVLPTGQMPPSNVLVVKPYTYDIALVGSKSSTGYGIEDGEHSEGYNKHGDEGDHLHGYDAHEPYYMDREDSRYQQP